MVRSGQRGHCWTLIPGGRQDKDGSLISTLRKTGGPRRGLRPALAGLSPRSALTPPELPSCLYSDPRPLFPTSKLSTPHTTSPSLLGLPDLLCVLFNLILLGEKVASRRPGKGGNTASVKEGRLQREHTKKFFFKSMVINAIQKEKRKEKLTPQSLKNTAH